MAEPRAVTLARSLRRFVFAGEDSAYQGRGGDDPVSGEDWYLAREFIWGERFPEPLVLIDWTDDGDVAAATAEVLHYVHDALGSVIGLTDAGDPDATPDPIAAKLVERYDYDPYGHTYIESWDAAAGGGSGAFVRQSEPVSAYGNPFMWTAQRYDAGVGLYSFPARAYSPRLGRWLQRDPLPARHTERGQINVYNINAM